MVLDDKAFAIALGKRIQQLRQSKGLTLDQGVENALLSVSRSSLSAIENGNQDISARDLYALSTALGFGLSELLDEVNDDLLRARHSSINLDR